MKKTLKRHKKLEIVGHCPDCGAPIWAELPAQGVPINQYSCGCRLKAVTTIPYVVTPNSAPYNPNESPFYPNSSNTWCTQTMTQGDRKDYRVVNIPQFSIYHDQ